MFSFSALESRCNIKVAYISSERGLVDNVSIYEANHHAKLNPGTQFIFRNRDFVKYLNINEVNKLTPAMGLPKKRSGDGSCSGIVGLNLEGDTSRSVDVAKDEEGNIIFGEIPDTGGSTQNTNVISDTPKTTVNFYGGGGVGVQAAPIVGIDGSIMAVHVIHGGYGYQYPPVVDIHDDNGNGAGVVAKAILKTKTFNEVYPVQEYDAEEDYEEYVLDKCVPTMDNVGYGNRWGPDGKNLGKWDPSVYFNASKDPIAFEIQKYQDYLLNLKTGSTIQNNRIISWWTTRSKPPLRITSQDKVTREKFNVRHPAWGGGWDGNGSSSQKSLPAANATFGVSTGMIDSGFVVYTSGGQRRDLQFRFTAVNGDHSFQIRADSFKDNASPEEIKIKIRKNTEYKVVATSRKGLRDEGLLKEGTFGTGGNIAQRQGTSDSIFADIRKTAPDDDDLQVKCKQGIFTSKKNGLFYEFKDAASYNAGSDIELGIVDASKNSKVVKTEASFMNQFAISPVPPSNVVGSAKAGITYVFEWEENFPYEGSYVFNVQCDNEARLFIDGSPVENFELGIGGAAGHVLSKPAKLVRYMPQGISTIRLDLLNHQIREIKKFQTAIQTSDEVKFDISISSMFSNGITIEGLGIDVSSVYDGPVVKETITKKVEYGRVYPVKITSSGYKQTTTSSTKQLEISGLNPDGELTIVNDTQIIMRGGTNTSGQDVTATFAITSGNATFSGEGSSRNNDNTFSNEDVKVFIKGEGDVTLTLSWYNTERQNQVLNSIKIGSTIWTQTQGNVLSPYTYVTRGDQGVAGFNDDDVITPGIKPMSSWGLANLADRYNFDKKRWEVQTNSGKWLPTTWEDMDYEGWTSIPAPEPPGRQMSGDGSETHPITLLGTESSASAIQLKTKGERVIAMEDLPGQEAGSGGVDGPGFFDDLICSVSNGRFFGISGSTCNFMVNSPTSLENNPELAERIHVFNTVSWMQRANRQLWRINPSAGKDADFLNQFGVLPFDPTAVKKIKKKIPALPPNVKFELGDDGQTYLKVVGNGRVKVGFEMDVDDEVGNRFGAAVREVKIFSDEGQIILKRTGTRFEKLSGTGNFSSGKKYLVKSLGGSRTSGSQIGADKTILQFDDAVQYGFDGAGYVNVKVKSITPIDTPELKNIIKFNEQNWDFEEGGQLASSGYETVISTDDYAGFHTIIWHNLNFPESGNYSVSVSVDDNVVLTFAQPNEKPIVIEKKGFRIRGDGRTGTGKSVITKYFKKGTYTLTAELEQIQGAPLNQGNPMALAVDVKAGFTSEDREVISAKSWNENPMGVAMTIDAPLAPTPKEPPPLQEGRCPNNPLWTTRSTDYKHTWDSTSSELSIDVEKNWFPVRTDGWEKFMNRYAISPIPPLGLKGTDGAGTVYRNTWKVEIPYRGFYGLKGSVDDFGRILIDGVEVLGPNADTNLTSYKEKEPTAKKILLEKGRIEITAEVENTKQFIWKTIDKKIFSTADWASKQNNTSTTIEGAKNVDVTFKVSSASLYANNIDMRGVFSVGKSYGGPNFNETYNRNIEVGRVYDVVFTSNNTAQKSSRIPVVYKNLNPRNNPIEVTNNGKSVNLKDGSRDNINAIITIDKTDGGSVIFTDDGKGLKVTGGTAAKRVKTTITLRWSDNPRSGGVSLDSFSVADKTWTRTNIQDGSVTKDVYIYPDNATANQNNNANIRLRNKGKNVIQMEDWTDNDWVDIMASATDGEFYDMVGNTCKYRIPSKDVTTIEYGKGFTGGTKDGVSYDGPPISTYVSGALGPFITPTWNTDEEYIRTHNGTTWTMAWNNVNFPETGTYDIQVEADDKLTVKLDGVEVASAEVGNGISKTQFNAPEGKRKLELILMNLDFNNPFSLNPAVAAVKITKKTDVAEVDPKSGTSLGKPWTVNPIGISAVLIPPPCPKPIEGVGVVTSVVIDVPGNGFEPPLPPDDDGDPPGPPVIIEIPEIVPEDSGINYSPDDRVCIVNKETGEERCFIPPKGPFGEIEPFSPEEWPEVPPGDPPPPGEGDPPPTAPPTVTLLADPPVIPLGDCTTLVYTSRSNTKLEIDNGVGSVPVVEKGTAPFCPTDPGQYIITITGTDGVIPKESDDPDGDGDGGGSDPEPRTAKTTVLVVTDPNDPSLTTPPPTTKSPPPNGYLSPPDIIVRGRGTGIGYKGIPRMKPVLDPIGVDPNRLLQITDLPGLKQTGFYDGKPYYGAVFYENGLSYAGYYDTPGQKVRIYASLQESITAQVTTRPSAIQRGGTDVNSNNPQLNIPGTPDNLT
tara:strand:- start:853 stop:7662 length:6810 start_codon:yes stop_codon:yes gene_type:complete